MVDVKQDDNLVWGGCYLCTNTLYFDTPDCIGCSGTEKCLCITEKFCCKMGADNFGIGLAKEDKENDICLLNLFCLAIGLTSNIASPICRQDAQQCCFVGQAALPPADDIPKTIGTCLLTCWSEKGAKGCMKKYNEL